MRSELPVASQPLQVLHVSEQEEDVFAFGMGLKQPGMETQTLVTLLEPTNQDEFRVLCHTAVLIAVMGVALTGFPLQLSFPCPIKTVSLRRELKHSAIQSVSPPTSN